MTPVELARWQGAIDERTKMTERRMDALNGSVALIQKDIADIKNAVHVSAEFRDGWRPLLEQLRDNTAATKAMHDRRSLWLEGWRLKLVAAGVVLPALGVAANLVLNILHIH